MRAAFSLLVWILLQTAFGWTFMPGDRVKLSGGSGQIISRAVREDGTILMPSAGKVAIALLTPDQASERLSRLLGAPWIVQPVAASDAPIQVLGMVARATAVHVKERFGSAQELIAFAQPMQDVDRGSVLLEVPLPRGGFQSLVCDLRSSDRRVEAGSHLTLNLLNVQKPVSVVGAVVKPSEVNYRSPLTLEDAIKAAGGPLPVADSNKIIVTRNGEAMPTSLETDQTFLLQPGDVIQVLRRSHDSYVTVTGGVVQPGLVDWVDGISVLQAIKLAGGVRSNDRYNLVVIRNMITNPKREIRLNLSFLENGRLPNVALVPGDVIELVVGKGN